MPNWPPAREKKEGKKKEKKEGKKEGKDVMFWISIKGSSGINVPILPTSQVSNQISIKIQPTPITKLMADD